MQYFEFSKKKLIDDLIRDFRFMLYAKALFPIK